MDKRLINENTSTSLIYAYALGEVTPLILLGFCLLSYFMEYSWGIFLYLLGSALVLGVIELPSFFFFVPKVDSMLIHRLCYVLIKCMFSFSSVASVNF